MREVEEGYDKEEWEGRNWGVKGMGKKYGKKM
jgi:hypothetical protein